ncbi:MAG: hypothetical protein COA97_05340 [Flavobacteriales bacterium]|nr:MAG: hypothetical protein COA97_05340 [Flavobacteriales bacterium]
MIAVKKIVLFLVLISIELSVYAQCAMCKAVVESSGAGEEINNGIIYLMFIPYILIGTIGYFIYRHHKKNQITEQA